MEESTRSMEVRLVERFLGWADANLPTAPRDSRSRQILESVAADLAERHGLPLRSPRIATLDDASAELLARLTEVGADPMAPLTSEQWRIVGAGIDLGIDEIADESARTVEAWLPNANGRSKVVLASIMHGCGVVKGALVQSWRR